MSQTSLVVASGDTIFASDHNKVVADVGDIYTTLTAISAVSPSAGQKDALAGTSGTPGSSNKFVTQTDARIAPDGTSAPGVVDGGLKIQSGSISTSGTGSGTVTFSTAFSVAPIVLLSMRVGVSNNSAGQDIIVGNSSGNGAPTTTGFPWLRQGTTGGTIYWLAIGN